MCSRGFEQRYTSRHWLLCDRITGPRVGRWLTKVRCLPRFMAAVLLCFFFFFQAEDGIRDYKVTGVQTCALPIYARRGGEEQDHRDEHRQRPLAQRRPRRAARRADVALDQRQAAERERDRLEPQIGRASCRERV